SLTISMNYVPVVTGFQTNGTAGTKDNIVAGPKDKAVDAGKKATEVDESQVLDTGRQDDQVTRSGFEGLLQQERQTKHINSTNSFNTVSSYVNTTGPSFVNVASPSPIARIEAIRLFLAYASFKDILVYQMDVKSDFLYEKIEEEVYVYQPPGFEDLIFLDKVYKVEKALHGLHQAPKA
nr:putative ribonuclease H-like domain-containing protein [Tanacetum cinerariifolium]